MTARYAIYLAPMPDTALWRFGSRVLGYDAATGQALPGFSLGGYAQGAWSTLTERPRNYGFHATLKAPFRLAALPDGALPELRRALSSFAASREAFDLGPLQVTALTSAGHDLVQPDLTDQGSAHFGFVALVQQRPSPQLAELERDAVAAFDRFRAPLTPDERARRRPDLLNPRQRDNLARWGYPHVGDDYRFHMTLTGEVANPEDAADKLARLYAEQVGGAHFMVDALVLFEQATSSARFRIIDRFVLRSPDDTGPRPFGTEPAAVPQP